VTCSTQRVESVSYIAPRIDTTQLYTDEIELDDLTQALADAYLSRNAQVSPDWTTLDASTLKYPRNRLMEAAGIEPASADAPE
jgi:hypothetical protein